MKYMHELTEDILGVRNLLTDLLVNMEERDDVSLSSEHSRPIQFNSQLRGMSEPRQFEEVMNVMHS